MSQGDANRGRPLKVFDWDKAAELIKQEKPIRAEAGLAGDWSYTGGIIYERGTPIVDSYTYLASTWAIPTLIMDGEEFPCYTMDSEWTSGTKWPDSSLKILNESN